MAKEVKALLDWQHDLLSVFLIGYVAGTKSKKELEFDCIVKPENGKLETIFNSIHEAERRNMDIPAVILNSMRSMGIDVNADGAIHEEVIRALKLDSIVKSISRISTSISMPGRGTVGTQNFEALRDLLNDYLDTE